MVLLGWAICIDSAVGAVFVHFVNAEEERIVENVDDALAGHNRVVAKVFISSVLIVFELERVP